jgi:hypothetical protein
MSGERIEKAKESLILFLNSLPTDSYFNVVSFGTSFRNLYEQPVKYTLESRSEAISTIKTYSANLGGTEI